MVLPDKHKTELDLANQLAGVAFHSIPSQDGLGWLAAGEYRPFAGVMVNIMEKRETKPNSRQVARLTGGHTGETIVCVFLSDQGSLKVRYEQTEIEIDAGRAVAIAYDLSTEAPIEVLSIDRSRYVEVQMTRQGASNACIALGVPIPRVIEALWQNPDKKSTLLELPHVGSFPLFVRSMTMSDVPVQIASEVMRLKIGEMFSYFSSISVDTRAASAIADSSRVKKVKEYLEENIASDETLVDLARMVGLSRTALSKGFKEEYGFSLKDYRSSIRFSYAEHLLKTTLLSINEISIACGYNSAGNFSRAFKQRFDLNPSDLREKN